MKRKKVLILIARIVVSALLLVYLLSHTAFSEIFGSLQSADLFWLSAAFVSLYAGKVLTGYRWQALLAAHNIRISLLTLIGSLFVGQFFNNFFPTIVGGDAVRAYDTATYSKQSTKSITTVVVDRMIGLLALILLAVVAVVAGVWLGANVAPFAWLVVGSFAACLFAFFVLFDGRIVSYVDMLLRRLRLASVSDKMLSAHKEFLFLRDKHHTLLVAFLVSLALQANVVLHYYFISVALGLDVAFLYYCMLIPISLIVLLVPISVNGIGLREGVYVFLLSSLGVQAKDAIALSWIAFGLTLTQGAIGGIIFALRGTNFGRFLPKSLRLHKGGVEDVRRPS